MRTKERLAADLEAAGAPAAMITNARNGHYDDYESPHPTPIIMLVNDATRAGLTALAEDAKQGKYDATTEESEAWAREAYANDPELRSIMESMGLGPRSASGGHEA